jgi:hypothetical protein
MLQTDSRRFSSLSLGLEKKVDAIALIFPDVSLYSTQKLAKDPRMPIDNFDKYAKHTECSKISISGCR